MFSIHKWAIKTGTKGYWWKINQDNFELFIWNAKEKYL